MKEILELHKEVYPWLTIDLIKKGLEKLKNKRSNLTASNISDLTNPSCFTNTIEPHSTNETDASSDVVESLLLLPSTIMVTAREEEQTEPLQ